MTEAEKAAMSNLVAGAMQELAQDGHKPSENIGNSFTNADEREAYRELDKEFPGVQ